MLPVLTSRSAKHAYSWMVVAMLWMVAFLNYLDRIIITSMRDPIVVDFALNDAQFGLLTSVFLWSYGLLSPFGGFLADKYSRKKMIIFSAVVWSAVTLWTGLATSYHEMLVARIIMGISEACYIPAALALITDYHGTKTRSLATGIHMSGLYTGVILSGLGGYIAEWWGWRYGFKFFGIFGILYSVFLLFFLKDKSTDHSEGTCIQKAKPQKSISVLESVKILFEARSFIIVLIYFCAFGMISWLVWGWLPVLLKEHFRLSLGEAGISATTYIQISSFTGVIMGGIASDRWSRSNVRGRIYVVVAGFSLGAPLLFLMSATHIFGIAIVGMVFYGLARGFTDSNIMPIICQIIDDRYIGTGYGFLNLLSAIVGGGMVYIGGALRDAKVDLSLTFQVSAILMLMVTWLLLFIKLKKTTV